MLRVPVLWLSRLTSRLGRCSQSQCQPKPRPRPRPRQPTTTTATSSVRHLTTHNINTQHTHQHIGSLTNTRCRILWCPHRLLSTNASGSAADHTAETTSTAADSHRPIHHAISLMLWAAFGYLLAQTYAYVTDFPEPCTIALSIAQSSPDLQHTLGSQLQVNGLYSGNVTDTRATISIPVRGSNDSGVLHAKLYRASSEDAWRVVYLQYSLGSRSQRYTISTDAYNDRVEREAQQAAQVTGIDMSQLPDSVKEKMQQQIAAYHQHRQQKQRKQNT